MSHHILVQGGQKSDILPLSFPGVVADIANASRYLAFQGQALYQNLKLVLLVVIMNSLELAYNLMPACQPQVSGANTDFSLV